MSRRERLRAGIFILAVIALIVVVGWLCAGGHPVPPF